MRIFNIILGDITDSNSDQRFFDLIKNNRYEYWRYTTLNIIVITPDHVTIQELSTELIKCYSSVFLCVMQISIEDVAGSYPSQWDAILGTTPFKWFDIIKQPGFIPAWEKEQK